MSGLAQFYPRGDTGVAIAASVESAVRDGRLQPGARLPTVRAVATRLGVSPTTVSGAYRDLGTRGVLTADGRNGTVVAPGPPLPGRRGPRFGTGVRDLARGNPDPALLPSHENAIARAAFETARTLYGAPMSDPGLLELAREQFAADDIATDHVSVVGGALDGIERVLDAHLHPGDRVAVEDPCYAGFRDLLAAMSLRAEPVEVDDRGMRPAALEHALGRGVRAVLVTPRAHNPTGAALDGERCATLCDMLTRHPATLIVEDDHAAGVAGSVGRTLTGGRGQWAVIRSASKALGPDLRLGIVAGDAATIARVEGRRLLGAGWVSHLLQRTVYHLWSDPEVSRLLERATHVYEERRRAVTRALAERGISAVGRSGLNVWIPVHDEGDAAESLVSEGWGVLCGERFRLRSKPGLRVTISELQAHQAAEFAAAVDRSIRGTPGRIG